MDKGMESGSSDTLSKRPKADNEEETAENHCPVDLLPHEIVLSFDHILEQIFSYLPASDLFTCRLVSHRFRKFAQVPLGNKIKLVFYTYKILSSQKSRTGWKTLKALTQFLQQLSSPESATTLTSTSFPCTNFRFFNARIGDKVLQNFLNVSGLNIRKLSIIPLNKDRTNENILMDQLSRLLTCQAPYLEKLKLLFFHPTVEWQQKKPIEIQGSDIEKPSNRSNLSPLLKSDPEFQQITSRVTALPNKSCLKKLQIDGKGLAKVLELIFQISPKLQKVVVEESYYTYLLQPVSRVHLLRNLVLDLRDDYPKSSKMEVMEKILKENNLRLKKLSINFDDVLDVCKTNVEFEKKLVSMTNRILEQSRDTLEHITLTSVSFLCGMKMPSRMTRVREIEIEQGDGIYYENSTVFPKGFSLSEAFPKLTSVTLSESSESTDPDDFDDFLNCLNFHGDDDPTLSLSVNRVFLRTCCFDDCEFGEDGRTVIPALISQRIQKFFPNARIKT